MITDRKELFKSTNKVIIVSRNLIQELYEETGFAQLAKLTQKDKSVLTLGLVKDIKSYLYKKDRKGVGGRPRIEEDPTKLKGKALQRYRNRIYKRKSRERKKKTDETTG